MDNSDLKYDDEIDLRRVLEMLWISKRFIVSFVVLISAFFYIGSLFLEDEYTSRIVIVSSEKNSASTGMFSEYSGIASMAGINLPEQFGNNKELALEVMKSVDFFERLYKRELFSAELMAYRQYNPLSNTLFFDEEIYDLEKNKWKSGNLSKSFKPPLMAAYGAFHEDFFRIVEGDTFIRIEVTHASPFVAKKWVSKIFSSINLIIKERDKIEAESSLTFLKEELARKNIPVLERTLAGLVQQEMQKLMLSEISEDYVFKVIDSARVPEFPSDPNRSLIVILGILVGLTLAFIIVLVTGFYLNNTIIVRYIPPSIRLKDII